MTIHIFFSELGNIGDVQNVLSEQNMELSFLVFKNSLG